MIVRGKNSYAARVTDTAQGTIRSLEANVQSFEAVSYTHLRAHETVLDLVCRLLLEKKKKPKT